MIGLQWGNVDQKYIGVCFWYLIGFDRVSTILLQNWLMIQHYFFECFLLVWQCFLMYYIIESLWSACEILTLPFYRQESWGSERLCSLPKGYTCNKWQSWDLSPRYSDSDNYVLNHPPEYRSHTGSLLSKVITEGFINICTRQKTVSSEKVYIDSFLFQE